MLSLAQAAKTAGKTKPTLLRWIKSGKLSAVRNDDGSYTIDPAELSRVSQVPGAMGASMFQPNAPHDAGTEPGISAGEAAGLRARLEAAEAAIRFRDETLADLRRRLDTATAQVSQALEQVRLLTDQRVHGAAEKSTIVYPAPPATAWQRFLRWRRRPTALR